MATAGVQASSPAPVAVGDIFHVRVALPSLGIAGFGAYQVTLTYDAALLAATGVPANWGDAPTAETGGNLHSFSSAPLCDPVPTENSIVRAGSVVMTCAEEQFDAKSSTAGELVDFVLRCIAPGTATLGLSTVEDTFLLDLQELQTSGGNQGIYGDTFTPANVTCAGEALTPTPGSPEDAINACRWRNRSPARRVHARAIRRR